MEGYKFISTFWQDFTIADAFGVDAVKDTYNRAFEEWKGNYKMLTELVLVLNWRIWYWYEREGEESVLGILYNDLWDKTALYAEENLKGEEYEYYFKVTD